MPSKLSEFTKFLKEINLSKFRKKYSKIKIVEMDLPKNIQAISLLYQVYWNGKDFITFEEFYKKYHRIKKDDIYRFNIKTTMCNNCFRRGLKARIYRTWAGLITQIHGGYVAESVFGKGSVAMSRELDSMGADIYVTFKNKHLKYQVKKASYSGVKSGKPLPRKKDLKGKAIDIIYEVPTCLLDKRKQNGEFRTPYLRFLKDKRTKALPNGFVIFTKSVFEKEKKRITKSR